MAKSAVYVVNGGDEYLNSLTLRRLLHDISAELPHMERIEMDAAHTDAYGFMEAVSPSLLSDGAIVRVDNLETVPMISLKYSKNIQKIINSVLSVIRSLSAVKMLDKKAAE